ncbi:hypothetical protein [Streptomyces sp. NPDC004538]|uniref:hypothetical protein n=1 Tax=Streptomyces sp. NPDC004538 TaxID=3154279 RepID=UPI0033AD830B
MAAASRLDKGQDNERRPRGEGGRREGQPARLLAPALTGVANAFQVDGVLRVGSQDAEGLAVTDHGEVVFDDDDTNIVKPNVHTPWVG